MEVANPIWLWAFAGLAIPAAIHLLSRKEGRTIEIGSIRFLRESPTARFSHVKLNEIALFLLRCSILVMIVLLLAGLRVNWFERNEKWLVLEEGVQHSEKFKPLLERFRAQGYDVRVMASGFPVLSNTSAGDPFDNYWIALQELSSQPIDSIVVISYGYQNKFKGPRLAIPSHIKWIGAEAGEKEFIAEKIRIATDSVWIRRGFTSPSVTYFESDLVAGGHADSATFQQRRDLRVAIVKDEGFEFDHEILSASLEAIKTITPHQIEVETLNEEEVADSSSDFIFWLKDHTPDQAMRGTTITILDCGAENLPLLLPSHQANLSCASTGKGTWVITKRLTVDVALKENLTLELARLILPPAAAHEDLRTVPEQMIGLAGNTGIVAEPDSMKSADHMLMLLLLLTLTGERLLAFRRKQ